MSTPKARLTVTVDPTLLEAAQDAVAEGRSPSLSAWVSLAIAERIAKERRLTALAEAVSAYETDFGVISDLEMADQARADRTAAVVIRGSARTGGRTRSTAKRR
jgi:hypothetical protein